MALITALLIGSIATGIASTIASAVSTASTNKSNREINEINNQFSAEQADIDRQFQGEQADETRAFNAAEAEKQRQWQEQMSNTEVQRRAADLQAAGFNPMLAVTNGSASTPGAATATSGMVGGSRAQASGFIPMKAMDWTPMAAMSSNLGHMVVSAQRMEQLERIAQNNPGIVNSLMKANNAMSKGMTRASRVPSESEIIKELKSAGMWR